MPDRSLPRLQEKWGPLTRRTINVLICAGVTPERLPAMTDWELHALKDLGQQVFKDIRAAYPRPGPTGPTSPTSAPDSHDITRGDH